MKGYKMLSPDGTCSRMSYGVSMLSEGGIHFEVGKTYEMEEEPIYDERGFHFYEYLIDCIKCYLPTMKVVEVEASGAIRKQELPEGRLVFEKAEDVALELCTNRLTIVRELTWDEVLRRVNTGKHCTGVHNTGNGNTGDENSGSYNAGHANAGNWNTGFENAGDGNSGDYNTGHNNVGHRNTGELNSGDYNTGSCNTGSHNAGSYNSGSHNAGDWNLASCVSGCFCTSPQKILMFNKPSSWTMEDWMNSEAKEIMGTFPSGVIRISPVDMTREEKLEHPEYETTDGYLKCLDNTKSAQKWWRWLGKQRQDVIKALPNFDAKVFGQCTGVDIEDDEALV